MSDRFMKNKQDKELMQEVEDWANEVLDTDNFKVVSEESFKDLFEKGHCAVNFKSDGSMETVTDKYVFGFDPYLPDEDTKGTFTIYKNGKILNFKKEEDERTS